jgi:formylmethanofuran dehydrogenase subunit E
MKPMDKGLAKMFINTFNFGFSKRDFRNIIRAKPEPITSSKYYASELGICDDCGEFSEELSLDEGNWLCPECVKKSREEDIVLTE